MFLWEQVNIINGGRQTKKLKSYAKAHFQGIINYNYESFYNVKPEVLSETSTLFDKE